MSDRRPQSSTRSRTAPWTLTRRNEAERSRRQSALEEWRAEVIAQTACPALGCSARRGEPCQGRRRAMKRVHAERQAIFDGWVRQHELEELADRERARG